MSNNTTVVGSTELSLLKQSKFEQYAKGELTWYELGDKVSSIAPALKKRPLPQRIAIYLAATLTAFLSPLVGRED